LLAVLLGAGIGLEPLRGAAPPVAPGWVAGELRRVEQTNVRSWQAALAGDFTQALRLARETLADQRRLQGTSHAQTRAAVLVVERWQRLTRLPEAAQRQAGTALLKETEGRQYWSRRRFPEAVAAFREALAIWEKGAGETHLETASACNTLAFCLLSLGKGAEALPLYRQALQIQRKVLGEEHAFTAGSYNNVAGCLGVLGRRDEALPLARKAHAIYRKVRGEEHRDTIQSLENLAACLVGLGRHAAALPLFRNALRNKQKLLGEEHVNTIQGYHLLAACLRDLGKYAESLPLYRRVLETRRKALGDNHADTATSYDNVAFCLSHLGRKAEALPLSRQALLIRRKVLGERHLDTAHSCINTAVCLNDLGKGAEALPLYRQALQIRLAVRGEKDPDTAMSYYGLAACLHDQGKQLEALPLFRKALEIIRETRGEEHLQTAVCCNGMAYCLNGLGKEAEALPLYRQALRIRRQALGEKHRDTATSCNNVASCLHHQGKHADALPLYRQALAICLEVLGEEDPDTAMSCNNVAACLNTLGRQAEALTLYRKALTINRKVWGEEHPSIALTYNNTADCLTLLGRIVEALKLQREALAIARQAQGDEHPATARSYHNVAFYLYRMRKPAAALPLCRKALAINRKALGEEHPDTAQSYNSLADCLDRLGKHAEAIHHLRLALPGFDVARQSAGPAGFDRSRFAATRVSGRPLLAGLLAGEGKAAEAWRHAEAHLARGLLEALVPEGPAGVAEAAREAEVARLDRLILPLLGMENLTARQENERDDLVNKRRILLAEMVRDAAVRLDKLVWTYQEVQKHLRADDALLLWTDQGTQHWGCVLRRDGEPRWTRLPGSGKGGEWTLEDWSLLARVHAAVREVRTNREEVGRLLGRLRQQRLSPLEKHLKAEGKLPAVRRLVVIPVGQMASVPVELLAEGYTVSYAPSATLYSRGVSKHRSLCLDSLVALGDPTFQKEKAKPPAAPAYGLLLRAILPGGKAAHAGLRAGDVLMRYNGVRLRRLADFKPVTKEGESVKASAWREGEDFAVRLASGPLDASLDERPIDKALADWRRTEALVRGETETLARLPGTRYEVEAIASLVGKDKTSLLLGSAASEQKLDRLRKEGTLSKARVIHLATHGQIHLHSPEHSALALAADALPDPVEQQRRGRKLYDGFLRVRTIVDSWKLDADLVVLSACETGLGKDAGGEGLLGFAQAFLQKGARAVVLSRWKVDDTATALLMLRFYENLLGKGKNLQKALGRAEALAEAKMWLAGLSREEALALTAGLVGGELRGTVQKLKPPSKPDNRVKLPGRDKPFAHPAYWAAFVLVGDPD
jgi:CHAT domain-containing protein/tetratricopeptide (TPR) repeat protein